MTELESPNQRWIDREAEELHQSVDRIRRELDRLELHLWAIMLGRSGQRTDAREVRQTSNFQAENCEN